MDDSGVGKLSSTLVSGRETSNCMHWPGVQPGQRLQGMVGPYWETCGGNVKQLTAVGQAHVGSYARRVCNGGVHPAKGMGLRSKLRLECRQGFLLWPKSQV